MHKGIYQDQKTKRWYIQTSVTLDGQTKFVTIRKDKNNKSYESKRAADDDYDRAIAYWITTHTQNDNELLFDNVIKSYMDYRTKTGYAVGTNRGTYFLINKYLTPYFTNLTVNKAFTLEKMRNWHNCIISDDSLSNKRKSDIITRIKDILKYCYQLKYITSDTFQDLDVILFQVKHTKKLQKERKALTQEQVDKLLSVIDPSSQDYVMFKLYIFLGCRIGEFLALMPNCINFDDNYIEIKQQVLEGTGVGSWILTNQLKTDDSHRKEFLTGEVAELLKEYISTTGLKENQFLFYGKKPMSRNTFRRKLYDYESKAGIPHSVPHEMRHTAATLLLSKATNMEEVKAVSKRLGHSMSTCLDIYQKSREEIEKDLLSKLYN